jgi:hypothetical protein
MAKAVTTCYSARTLTQQLLSRHDIPLGYLIRKRVQGMAKAVTTCYSARTLIQQLSDRDDITLGYLIRSSLPESCCVSVLAL